MPSEICKLVQRIDEEAIAMCRAMYSLAYGTSRHDFIEARYRAIDEACKALTEEIGNEQETDNLVTDLLDSIIVLCSCEFDMGLIKHTPVAPVVTEGN